jgi:hypothetical protein
MKKYIVVLLVSCIIILSNSCNMDSSDLSGGMILSDLIKPVDGVSKRATSTRVGEDGKPIDHNSDNSRVMPGETKVILDAKGPGIVTHMWFTFLGPGRHVWAVDGSATHQEMLLKVYYDGSENPGIEVPFGDFFANCFGKRSEVISLPVVVEDADSYNSFWPMPFQKSIRIEVVNQSKTKNINLLYYNIDWIKKDRLPKKTPYFYAQYRQEYPAENGKDYLILETEGKGHYVGTVMAVRSRSPFWFGEGDEKIYIDGEKEPSIWGTGTEDYFLSAWGLQSNVNTPYFGTVYFDHGDLGGHTSAFRWHLADPVVFEKSIKVTIEHGGWISADENKERRTHSWNEREDDISTVAYWYQTGIPAFSFQTPPSEDRILPSLDIIFPAKDVVYSKSFKNGKASIQSNLEFYMDGQLVFSPSGSQASVEIPFNVEKKEPVRLLLSVTKAPDYGIWQVYLNGVKLGDPMNLYSEEIGSWEHPLLDFWPDPGRYQLVLRLTGKDRRSNGELLGIEAVRLRERRPRVENYAFDKDNDWMKDPKLYR